MIQVDFFAIRNALAVLPSDHDASGQHRPTVDEIFTPKQHANALDPNTPVVVGARGTGKSFWAGVLEQNETREVAANAYPNLGLNRLIVRPGYNGLAADDVVTAKTIDARVPPGSESEKASDFWLAIILRATKSALNPNDEAMTVREVMEQYADPEDWQKEIRILDEKLTSSGNTLLIIFDALDTISKDWKRSNLLLDALFEAIWSLRARRSIRAKIFIRPEQLNDEALSFVELPKLRSGCVELNWAQVDLYGLLFWRLATNSDIKDSFGKLVKQIDAPVPDNLEVNRHYWPLIIDTNLQKNAMTLMAGAYMGSGKTKGGTYNWPYKHLGDANGKVTPRSFIKLFVEAAKRQAPVTQVISADGIRHGLREASKVRVDQLGIEYKWIKRALAPLAGLTIPCTQEALYDRWKETNTIKLILDASSDSDTGFLPPFPPRSRKNHMELLASAMAQIGLFSYRSDGRIDIPDLFRVAAQMLKRGGTPPIQRS